jgi:hypothetical protein
MDKKIFENCPYKLYIIILTWMKHFSRIEVRLG